MIKTKIIGMLRDSSRYIIDMDIPEDWYKGILEYQTHLGKEDTLEGLSNTLTLIIVNFINDRQAELKKKAIEEIEQVKKHKEFQEAAKGREQVYTTIKNEGKKT